MPRTSKTLAILALATATISTAAHLANLPALIHLFKPLPTLLCLTLALRNASPSKSPFAAWISIGLALSTIGDLFLIAPDRFFLPGLSAFLLAHLAYLRAFTRNVKFPANAPLLLAFLALASLSVFVLRAHLPAGFLLPVTLYSAALTTMTAQALGRSLLLRTPTATLAAVGALLFLASDSLLAIDHFLHPLPLASLLILAPYYTAQLLLAQSTTQRIL